MSGTSAAAAGGGPGEIMLFGVRVVVDSMRKSVSLNNLSQYEHPSVGVENADNNKEKAEVVAAAGYGSADDAVHHSSGPRSERKRGVPWTEEEHKLFLIGLQKVGKGDWRGISRNFVKSRTPTQVASHAQKYFLRRININRRRRRSSLFDITTDTVAAGISMGERVANPSEQSSQVPSPTTSIIVNKAVPAFTLSTTDEIPRDNMSIGQAGNQCANLIRCSPSLARTSSRTISDVDLNLNSPPPLSLNLSLPTDQSDSTARRPAAAAAAYQMMPPSHMSNNGDSIISVA